MTASLPHDQMQNKPRMLVIARVPKAGEAATGAAIGTGIFLEQVADAFDVDVVRLDADGLATLGAARGGRFGQSFRTLRSSLRAVGQAFRVAMRRRPDVIYLLPATSTLGLLRTALIVMAVRAASPRSRIVFHVRNGNFDEPRSGLLGIVQKWCNGQADTVFVLSERLLPEALAHIGLASEQIAVLPNTIDAAMVPATQTPAAPNGPIRLLYLSNYIPSKGYILLLNALEKLAEAEQGSRFSATFRGAWLSEDDRTEAARIAARISAKGLSVDLGGRVEARADAQALYASHDVFCLPTSYAAEAQPRSILEAMANRCAVVATDYRAIPDMVSDRRTGRLIPADADAADLANALAALQPDDVRAWGDCGAKVFQTAFSDAAIRKRLLDCLLGDRLLARRSEPFVRREAEV